MEEYTEVEAYKHLLEITENIIVSLNTQQEIVSKYETLKKSILNKIVGKDTSYYTTLIQLYKEKVDDILRCIGQFESEIEGDMNKENFLTIIDPIMEQMSVKAEKIENRMKIIEGKKGENNNNKILFLNQLSTFQYTTKQIKNKFENMGLMIEVHNKMHEIILQASDKQSKRTKKQLQYNKRLEQMEHAMGKIVDAKLFLEQCSALQEKKKKMDIAKKNLVKLLFQS